MKVDIPLNKETEPNHNSVCPGTSFDYTLYIYLPKQSTWAGCDTKLIFKQSLTGLHSEFSFSKTGCHTKVKVPRFPNHSFFCYYSSRRMNGWFHCLVPGNILLQAISTLQGWVYRLVPDAHRNGECCEDQVFFVTDIAYKISSLNTKLWHLWMCSCVFI